MVNKGETVIVSSWVLNAADVDSDSLQVTFTLEEPYSDVGEFVLVKDDVSLLTDADTYTLRSDGKYEKPVKEWTQQNIVDMEVSAGFIPVTSAGQKQHFSLISKTCVKNCVFQIFIA